ncbi:MAG: YigZ family protein [Bacteroides sp.]|nr:YigZ family protein [Bacteroides sp.]
MKDLYKTISSDSKGLYKDRGSRFISLAFPVVSETEIKEKLDFLRKEYHDARHHCFAWRLGPDLERYRVNDDGEPSGSAGRPIFAQIQSRELTNILVVVIRYFGGTLLGVGGLINAYRSSTSDALDQANIIERRVETLIKLNFEYEAMNSVMSIVKDFGLKFDSQNFDLVCSLTLRVWMRQLQEVTESFKKVKGCSISIEE